MMTRFAMSRRSALIAAGCAGLLTAAGCAAPGSQSNKAGKATQAAIKTLDKPAAATMKGYFETGFPLPKALTDEFTKQFPDVTWDIREDQFAVITQNALRVLADNPPDLMRMPSIQNAAKAGVLLNLEPYAKAYGWDQWPASQLEQLRIDDTGARGAGDLYGHGFNYSVTGVFYHKGLAEKIGMTQPPATLDEFDAALEEAKKAGLTGVAQFNGGATGGLAFPLQNLMGAYGDITPIKEWIYQKEGASIVNDVTRQAAEHLSRWIKAGYFAADINSMDYAAMMGRFTNAQSLFIFDGDWESGNFDTNMKGEVGFFLMPTKDSGAPHSAMSSPLTVGVSAKATNPDNAAFFLNWVATNDEARRITVEVGGSHPMGPEDASMPELDKESVTAQTLQAGGTIAADNGAMDFIANATDSIYAKGWTPNLQQLAAGAISPADMLSAVQETYEAQVAQLRK